MKKIYLFLTSTFITATSLSQNFAWAKQMGSTPVNDKGRSITVDATGNVYTTGSFAGTSDFDPGAGVFNLTSVGSDDIFISKLDASGNFVWAKQMGGLSTDQGSSIVLDASGNVYVTGRFMGTSDFDPGAGTFNLTSLGMNDIFVSKLNASGNFVWAKQMGSTGDDVGNSIALDASGNVYTTGWFQNTVDFDPGAGTFNMTSTGGFDIFISKLDASGNFVFAKQFGGTSTCEGFFIALDAAGNIYTTGDFYGTADFDPGAGTYNLTSNGASDIFISQLNASGNFVWAKQIGAASAERGLSLTIDGSGNIISTGFFSGTVDFDPGAGTFNLVGVGGNDIFVSKLDAAGNFVWAKGIGSGAVDQGYSIKVDASNNVYTTGLFQNTADFDPGAGVFNLTSTGGSNVFISKLDASGNFVWALQVGVNNNSFNPYDGYYMFLDAAASIYITGSFQGSTDFNPGVGVYTMTTSPGTSDVFVLKLVTCTLSPSQPSAISGPTVICNGAGATTYSIATVVGATAYSWSLPGGWSGSSATNTISGTPGTTGIFTVAAFNACGTSPQQTLAVTVNPQPTITVNSGSICSGNSFTIVPSGANTYTFQGGSAVVSPTTNASYTVVGTSTAGCISASPATSNVTVSPLPTISGSTSNTLICVGQSVTLTASGASTYTWNPGGAGTNITVSPTVTATYTITGTSAQGCSNSSVFTQSVSTCAGINPISNSISEINVYPNPFNNKITIVSNGEKQSVQIFNALGSLIYKTEIGNEKIEINLEKENSGIYFIRIASQTKKLIKE